MNTKEAKQALLQGKKVTKKIWDNDEYIYLDVEGEDVFDERDFLYCELDCFTEEDNWEIFESIHNMEIEFNKILKLKPEKPNSIDEVKKYISSSIEYQDKLEKFIKERLMK